METRDDLARELKSLVGYGLTTGKVTSALPVLRSTLDIASEVPVADAVRQLTSALHDCLLQLDGHYAVFSDTDETFSADELRRALQVLLHLATPTKRLRALAGVPQYERRRLVAMAELGVPYSMDVWRRDSPVGRELELMRFFADRIVEARPPVAPRPVAMKLLRYRSRHSYADTGALRRIEVFYDWEAIRNFRRAVIGSLALAVAEDRYQEARLVATGAQAVWSSKGDHVEVTLSCGPTLKGQTLTTAIDLELTGPVPYGSNLQFVPVQTHELDAPHTVEALFDGSAPLFVWSFSEANSWWAIPNRAPDLDNLVAVSRGLAVHTFPSVRAEHFYGLAWQWQSP